MHTISDLTRRLLDCLFPVSCVHCGLCGNLPAGICTACAADMPRNSLACRGCALPVNGLARLCGACQRQPRTFDACLAPLLYTDPVAGYVQRLKYAGDLTLLDPLVELMAADIARHLETSDPPDRLVPMPLHWTRLWQRGFNQSERLGEALCHHPVLRPHGLRQDRRLCKRVRATPSQSGLDQATRRSNVSDAFRASARAGGLHLAIIDDVLTTGASAEALAATLKAAGARRVELWCVARTPAPHSSALPP